MALSAHVLRLAYCRSLLQQLLGSTVVPSICVDEELLPPGEDEQPCACD